MTKHLDRLAAASRSNAPQRRLRPSVVDTVDLLAEYNGTTFRLEDLEASATLDGIEFPISGDDIARVTCRGV